MNRYFISKLIALLSGIFLVFIAINHNQDTTYNISGSAYGTEWSVTSPEYINDFQREDIITIINNIDMIASNYKNDSEIRKVNIDTNDIINISDDLYNILEIAKNVQEKSNGYYNIMLGKISSMNGFAPSFEENLIQNKDSDYFLNKDNKQLLRSSNNWFDLSSLAKGYAVQKIHDYLLKNDLPNHLIDIGGEIIINGKNKNNSWNIGIQNPNNFAGQPIEIISSKNNSFLAIATSGEYRNYKIDEEGAKISHTFDPNTLKSIDNSLLSVTVIDDNSATYADAFATAFNAMGKDLAIEIANKNGIATMLIYVDNDKPNIIYSSKWNELIL